MNAVISPIRDGSDTPTTVEATRGSRRENCSAAAASGTPYAAQARCMARTASRTASLASRYAYLGWTSGPLASIPPP